MKVALEHLTQPCEATDRDDDAAKWREELETRKEDGKKPVKPRRSSRIMGDRR
jgi:hypothetical protein